MLITRWVQAVEGFKVPNARHGIKRRYILAKHTAGLEVLRIAARRMRKRLKPRQIRWVVGFRGTRGRIAGKPFAIGVFVGGKRRFRHGLCRVKIASCGWDGSAGSGVVLQLTRITSNSQALQNLLMRSLKFDS
jgi:hypothetical protein